MSYSIKLNPQHISILSNIIRVLYKDFVTFLKTFQTEDLTLLPFNLSIK